ncbi:MULTISPECIES: hypothetical protein [Streptomyces]|nr:hypothetical protein [Streptomyces sp. DSM 40907]
MDEWVAVVAAMASALFGLVTTSEAVKDWIRRVRRGGRERRRL